MITYKIWRDCAWMIVTTTREIWRAIPHRKLIAAGCSIMGGIPFIPDVSHTDTLPGAAVDVPEPGSLAVFVLACAVLWAVRRRAC